MHFDRQRSVLVEYETSLELERLAGFEPSRLQIEIAHDTTRLHLSIFHRDGRIADLETCNRRQRRRLVRRCSLTLLLFTEIRPIGAALSICHEPDASAGQFHLADFELAAKQRQEPHTYSRLV